MHGFGCQEASQQKITSWYKHHQPWPSHSPYIPKFQLLSSSQQTGKTTQVVLGQNIILLHIHILENKIAQHEPFK
jgi:hypothetical protein